MLSVTPCVMECNRGRTDGVERSGIREMTNGRAEAVRPVTWRTDGRSRMGEIREIREISSSRVVAQAVCFVWSVLLHSPVLLALPCFLLLLLSFVLRSMFYMLF